MIHFTLIVIIVNVPGAAVPVVQEPIIQVPEPTPPDPDLIQWRCPHCKWWNAYSNMTSLSIGSKAHMRRCKGYKSNPFG